MDNDKLNLIVQQVLDEVLKNMDSMKKTVKEEDTNDHILVEASARHVHLSKEDMEALFGKGHELTVKKNLSQPGEFLSTDRVKVVTAKGTIENIAVLGPLRNKTQVELSLTDTRQLGIKAPIRLSGELSDAADVILVSQDGKGSICAKGSAVVARAHIHMTPKDAEFFSVKNGQIVSIKVVGDRTVTFDNVIVRVSDNYKLAVHIDYDEANSCNLSSDSYGLIVSPSDTNIVKQAKSEVCIQEKCVINPNEDKALPIDNKDKCDVINVNKKLITEAIAMDLLKAGCKKICFVKGTIVTPAAKDVFSMNRIDVEYKCA